ncbi:MAG: ABC transporter ATP-binding protein [Lentisphaerae bacterium]|nr:ABC transporter ATP-binding protein [Lentisphaerota bacterium]
MSEPLLEVKNLSISFRSGKRLLPAVQDANFSIRAGEMLALVGESGSGKSVTALALLGLLPPAVAVISQGQAWFQGQDLLQTTSRQWQDIRGRQIAMIFQEPMTALNPVLSIGQQLGEVLQRHQKNLQKQERHARCLELLQEVGLPDPGQRLQDYPHQLSGGMRQRVMIAMALACRPQLLLADEPTTALDVTVQAQIMALLDRLRRETGTAVLFITHNLALVSQYADQCAVMYAGHILEQGECRQTLQQPQHPYTRMLLRAMPQIVTHGRKLATIPGGLPEPEATPKACAFAPRCPFAQDLCRQKLPPRNTVKPGHTVRCHFAGQTPALPQAPAETPASPGVAAGPLLSVRELKVHFPCRVPFWKRQRKVVKAVDGLSLSLYPGETLALVGESGCGKTTVGKALVRLLEPSAGEIILSDGQHLEKLPRSQMLPFRKNVQMIFQDPYSSLNPRLMVSESLGEGLLAQGIGRTPAERRERQIELLQQVGLSADMLTRYPHQFSGGQRQRLVLARALAVQPQVIVCDECTSALDVSIQAQILNLLHELQQRLNLAYLFITHDLSLVSCLADRVAVMYLGRIVEQGSVPEIFGRPQHPYTKALQAAAPRLDAAGIKKLQLEGDVPSPISPPSGCHFHPRCPYASPKCRQEYPPEIKLSPTHFCRCTLTTP